MNSQMAYWVIEQKLSQGDFHWLRQHARTNNVRIGAQLKTTNSFVLLILKFSFA